MENSKKICKFDIKVVKEIIGNIDFEIRKNVGVLFSSIDDDNKNFYESEMYSKIISILNQLNKEGYIMERNTRDVVYDGLGNIGVFYNGQPEIFLYMTLKALKTHNNITFFEEDEIHKTTKILLDIINRICKKNKYNISINIKRFEELSEIYEYKDNIDKYIFINKYENYIDFTNKIRNKEIIYSSYGTMTLYLDDKNLRDTLMEIDEFVFKNNINLDLVKGDNIIEIVEKINSNIDNFCTVIFTKDSKKACYFIENIKSKNIFVNKNPDKDYVFSIDDNELTMRKKIYII